MSDMKEPYLFISYAREDLTVASKIVRTLEDLGISCWFDQRSIFGGQRFKAEIERGIARAVALIFVQSPNSMNSVWCARELAAAQSQGKPIVPALVAPVDSAETPLAELHWIDFSAHSDRDQFDRAIHLLIQALAVHAVLPQANALIAAAARRTGVERIAARLEDIEESVRATESFLKEIDANAPDVPAPWNEDDRAQTTERLAQLALGEELRDRQIMAHAAQTIARTGNLSALKRLASELEPGHWSETVYDAAFQIATVRNDPAPPGLTARDRLRILLNVGKRQLHATPLAPPILWSLAAAVLALWIVFFTQFELGEVAPTARLEKTVSATAYGLVLGLGISFTLFIAPRLKILRLWRYLLGALVGWFFVLAAFVWLNNLAYYRHANEYMDTLPGLAALFVSGFVLAAMLPSNRLPTLFARITLGCLGVFLALQWPCDWRNVYPRLIVFPRKECWAGSMIWISALLAIAPYVPDIRARLTEPATLWEQVLFERRRRK